MTNLPETVREGQARRQLRGLGFRLVKSRRCDPRCHDYGGYMIVDVETNGVVHGATNVPFELDLPDVEVWLQDRS